MSAFAIKDSGKRETFSTGSRRDTRDGKGRFDLLPPRGTRRLALHFENGAKKYGDDNWQKGQPLKRFLDSALRHTFAALEGKTDEDHIIAAAWNMLCAADTQERIKAGLLPKSLDDLTPVKTKTPIMELEPGSIPGFAFGDVFDLFGYTIVPYSYAVNLISAKDRQRADIQDGLIEEDNLIVKTSLVSDWVAENAGREFVGVENVVFHLGVNLLLTDSAARRVKDALYNAGILWCFGSDYAVKPKDGDNATYDRLILKFPKVQQWLKDHADWQWVWSACYRSIESTLGVPSEKAVKIGNSLQRSGKLIYNPVFACVRVGGAKPVKRTVKSFGYEFSEFLCAWRGSSATSDDWSERLTAHTSETRAMGYSIFLDLLSRGYFDRAKYGCGYTVV